MVNYGCCDALLLARCRKDEVAALATGPNEVIRLT